MLSRVAADHKHTSLLDGNRVGVNGHVERAGVVLKGLARNAGDSSRSGEEGGGSAHGEECYGRVYRRKDITKNKRSKNGIEAATVSGMMLYEYVC